MPKDTCIDIVVFQGLLLNRETRKLIEKFQKYIKLCLVLVNSIYHVHIVRFYRSAVEDGPLHRCPSLILSKLHVKADLVADYLINHLKLDEVIYQSLYTSISE